MFKHDATYERGDLTTDSDCRSQGDTRTEALSNIREAIELYVEDCLAAGDLVSTEAGKEFVDVEAA